jgi:hypothetical protein
VIEESEFHHNEMICENFGEFYFTLKMEKKYLILDRKKYLFLVPANTIIFNFPNYKKKLPQDNFLKVRYFHLK